MCGVCMSAWRYLSPIFKLWSSVPNVLHLTPHPLPFTLKFSDLLSSQVMVYDVRNKQNRPIYTSSIKTGKHTDPVWQVIWQEADIAKELNFFSVSSDGRVANW